MPSKALNILLFLPAHVSSSLLPLSLSARALGEADLRGSEGHWKCEEAISPSCCWQFDDDPKRIVVDAKLCPGFSGNNLNCTLTLLLVFELERFGELVVNLLAGDPERASWNRYGEAGRLSGRGRMWDQYPFLLQIHQLVRQMFVRYKYPIFSGKPDPLFGEAFAKVTVSSASGDPATYAAGCCPLLHYNYSFSIRWSGNRLELEDHIIAIILIIMTS